MAKVAKGQIQQHSALRIDIEGTGVVQDEVSQEYPFSILVSKSSKK